MEGIMDFKVNSAVIKVIGVGGGGCNAVNSMIDSGVKSAQFYAVNTDNQALMLSKAENRIQIGEKRTKGLGAGSDPSVGEAAAEESKEEIRRVIEGTDLLFIAAGMGGGTGTGAAPVIARIAKELGILTVAVVTKPFSFEGMVRGNNANKGIENLKKNVDTLVIIPNDKLIQSLPEQISMLDAFKVADDMLKQGIIGIVDLIATPSIINLDFADVNTVLRKKGLAHMGVGRAKGEKRVIEAVRQAISSPLLETTIEGAKALILNVTSGRDIKLNEVNEAATLVRGVIDSTANVIFGTTIDQDMNEEIKITIIATGFEQAEKPAEPVVYEETVEVAPLQFRTPAPESVPPLLRTAPQVEEAKPEPEVVEVEEPVVEEPAPVEEPEKRGVELPPFMRKLFGRKK